MLYLVSIILSFFRLLKYLQVIAEVYVRENLNSLLQSSFLFKINYYTWLIMGTLTKFTFSDNILSKKHFLEKVNDIDGKKNHND